MAQTRYIPINYPLTEEEQLAYIMDDGNLSAYEKLVLGGLIANYCRYGWAMTVEEICECSHGTSEKKVREAIRGLLFRKKVEMITSGTGMSGAFISRPSAQ